VIQQQHQQHQLKLKHNQLAMMVMMKKKMVTMKMVMMN